MAAALKKAKSLSRRQEQILDYIGDFCNQNAYPPTIREIQKELDISSTSVVDYNLNALEERGFIRRNRHISRGIELARFNAPVPNQRNVTKSSLLKKALSLGLKAVGIL